MFKTPSDFEKTIDLTKNHVPINPDPGVKFACTATSTNYENVYRYIYSISFT